MMTKITKKSMIIATIFIIAILLVSAAYIKNETYKISGGLSEYTARREDLITQQNQLQAQLFELNKLLEAEIENQKKLSDKLNITQGQTNNQGNSPGTQQPSPNPTPTPSPPPVTSAS